MTVLPLCILPNAAWLAHLLASSEAVIDLGEHYVKQSYRNRFDILHHQGCLSVSFPVQGNKGIKTPLKEIVLDHEINWKRLNWRSIQSAYASSPFFLYYSDQLNQMFNKEHDLLHKFSLELLEWSIQKLDFPLPEISWKFIESEPTDLDLRARFKGRKSHGLAYPAYGQVFTEQCGFVENLSVIDLLFNLGPEAGSYLRNLSRQIKT